jgi:hypothetical protein
MVQGDLGLSDRTALSTINVNSRRGRRASSSHVCGLAWSLERTFPCNGSTLVLYLAYMVVMTQEHPYGHPRKGLVA